MTISKPDAERVLRNFLQGKVAYPDDCAVRWLEDLLKYHLLQRGTDNRIEFRHQFPTLTESNNPIVVAEAIQQEIKRNPTFKQRLRSALKAGGIEALKAIFNHPLINIPIETIKGWIEAE